MFMYMLMFYMIIFMILMFLVFLYFLVNKIVIFMEYNLMKIMSIKMEFVILLDWVSILFMNVVILISMMVILYSIEYMNNDLNFNQFIMLVFMFIVSMMLMIVSPNLISILIGWDGLGLVSYCLVIFYQSKSSFNSGMITVLTNRLGDIMILISIGLMFSLGSWNFLYLLNMKMMIFLLLIIASFTKSAQLPFSSWLPLAMAAPTPVSSLVHSSTLVTAGVYLMIRLNYLMFDQILINLIMLISVITMFLSGLGANLEFDLKKIIALSTLSQLGIMFFSLSMKLDEITLFHLLMHAMFKSMLFMCAGVIIHGMLGNQDIRYISMVLFNMPMISMLFNCSTLSLCGFPFLSGFFSKDLILEMFLMSVYNKFILLMLFMSMGLTVMYSMRLIYYSFIKMSQLNNFLEYKSMNSKMGVSMYLLFILSVKSGLILSWILFSMKNMIYLTIMFKLMIYFFMVLGMLIGYISMIFYMKVNMLFYMNNIIMFFMMLWFMPMLYTSWNWKIMKFSNDLISFIELGWIEYFMGLNLIKVINKIFNLDIMYKNYFYLLIFFLVIVMFMIY